MRGQFKILISTITAFRNDPTDDTYCAPDYKAPSLYQQQHLVQENGMCQYHLPRLMLMQYY